MSLASEAPMIRGEDPAGYSRSQSMPRDTQLEQGSSLSQRSFRDLQKRQETGLWRTPCVWLFLGIVMTDFPWN